MKNQLEVFPNEFQLQDIKGDTYHNIPNELQEKKQWVGWNYETNNNGKATKVPYQLNGRKANPTNSSTWGHFQDVVHCAREGKFDGIGFVLSKTDDYIAVDIDDCIVEGKMNETARDTIELLDSYTEFSPSAKGLHIIVKGKFPNYIEKSKSGLKNEKFGIEVYRHSRFMTFTGDVENENIIHERTDELDDFFIAYFDNKEIEEHLNVTINTEPLNFEDDNVTWKKMFQDSREGKNIKKAFNGELMRNGDHSSTDYYLCQQLAYFCDKDLVKMDRMFRQSGLYREKWDSKRGNKTYGMVTLLKAAASKKKTISQYKNKYKKTFYYFNNDNFEGGHQFKWKKN